MGGNPFLGPFALVAISWPKKVQGPPLQTTLVMDFPPSKSMRPAPHNRYINSYKVRHDDSALLGHILLFLFLGKQGRWLGSLCLMMEQKIKPPRALLSVQTWLHITSKMYLPVSQSLCRLSVLPPEPSSVVFVSCQARLVWVFCDLSKLKD